MNFCPKCGNKLLPAARFCPGCGIRLVASHDEGAKESHEESAKPPVKQSPPAHWQTEQSRQNAALSNGFFQRVKGILISTRAEWEIVASEEPDTSSLMLRYVLFLALIPAVAIFIYTGLLGEMVMGFRVRSMSGGIVHGILQLVSAITSVYVISFITAWLAPHFDGQRNMGRALPLIAYSMTPMWLVGISHILPSAQTFKDIAIIIGGLYAIYLIFKGLPIMMDVPEKKAPGYTLAILLTGFVVMLGIGLLLGFVAGIILNGGGDGYGM